ncbi:MAG: GIY-YIG nuclease family protein [Pleurocapsa sp.]
MIPITDLKSLPKISGIYQVIDANNNVLYIGQAKNIYTRWNNGHHKFRQILELCGVNAYISYVEIPEWLLNRAENAAIAFYQPPLNIKSPSVV